MNSAAGMPPKLAAILAELADLVDFDERADYLIDLAADFQEVPARIAQRPFPAAQRVPACESEVYIWKEPGPDGALYFHFAVENPQGISAKALAVILAEGLNGARPEQIAALSEDFIPLIFGKELSMGKGVGLLGMLRMVKALAKIS